VDLINKKKVYICATLNTDFHPPSPPSSQNMHADHYHINTGLQYLDRNSTRRHLTNPTQSLHEWVTLAQTINRKHIGM